MKVFGGAAGSGLNFLNAQRDAINSPDGKRIKQSLHCDQSPGSLPERLSVEDLGHIARFANCAIVHYSANCVLLSACVHYNIEHKINFLRCENIASPLEALDHEVVDDLVFGRELKSSCFFDSLDDVGKEVFRRYEVIGERSCIVTARNYTLPFVGEINHDFNAVVLLDSDNKPRVHYLDAWKTFNSTPSMQELKSHLPESASFTVRSFGGN